MILRDMPIQPRKLGRTPLQVSRIALGCVTFGREIDQPTSFAILDHALVQGINLLDTAEAYGGGEALAGRLKASGIEDVREVSGEFHSSELILGRWLESRRCRDRIILQTKVAPPLNRRRVLDSIDASLNRLRTDAIDIFMFHSFDPHTPLQESLAALAEAVAVGKIHHAGCSNFTADQLRAAHQIARDSGLPRLEVCQSIYSLAAREIEGSVLPVCRELDIGVETYSPLGAGFLTGKYDPATRQAPPGSRFHIAPGHMAIYFHEDKFEMVSRLHNLSARIGVPVPRLAIAWVLQNQAVDTVLAGARTTAHIDSALTALDLRFDPAWHKELIGETSQETA